MAPKKAATTSLVGEYDKKLMTVAELRKYVQALLEEQTRMRKLRNLYQKDKNELLGFLKSTQENIVDRKGVELQKKLDIQQLIFDAEQESKNEDFFNRITELENNSSSKSNTTEAFIRVKEAQLFNKANEDALIADLTEKDREIQDLEFLLNLMLIQLKEKDFIRKRSLSNNYEISFQMALHEYDKNIEDILPEFSRNRVEKLQAVWGDSSSSENFFADIVVNMTAYFKDIYWKNLKSVENLTSVLIDLEKCLNNIMLNLRDIEKKNEQLRSSINIRSSSPRSSLINSPTFSIFKVQNFRDLLYENHLLTLKLNMLKKEYANLKTKFTSGMRKIHQKANFKTLLLERMIVGLQTIQNNIEIDFNKEQ